MHLKHPLLLLSDNPPQVLLLPAAPIHHYNGVLPNAPQSPKSSSQPCSPTVF